MFKSKFKGFLLFSLLFLLLSFSFLVLAQSHNIGDSDEDGINDDFDKCPNTRSREELPIMLRNPEFLGCSCSQIFNLMRGEYCKEIFCLPNRPLEIIDRHISSRPNPCEPSRCEGTTLIEFVVDEILCHQGREKPYECREIITNNAEVCINPIEVNHTFIPDRPIIVDIFDVVTRTYLDNSLFINLLNMRSKEELIAINDLVLNNINVKQVVDTSERVINNNRILVSDVSIIVSPDDYVIVEDFILVKRLIGDLSNKNVVFFEEAFFDVETQVVVWKVDYLKDDAVFKYRITSGKDVTSEFFVQGNIKKTFFRNLFLPILLILVLISFFILKFFILNDRNKVFK